MIVPNQQFREEEFTVLPRTRVHYWSAVMEGSWNLFPSLLLAWREKPLNMIKVKRLLKLQKRETSFIHTFIRHLLCARLEFLGGLHSQEEGWGQTNGHRQPGRS